MLCGALVVLLEELSIGGSHGLVLASACYELAIKGIESEWSPGGLAELREYNRGIDILNKVLLFLA